MEQSHHLRTDFLAQVAREEGHSLLIAIYLEEEKIARVLRALERRRALSRWG